MSISKRKRIAFVSDAIYPYNKGGKEKRLYEIATRLVKANQEVHIYTMKWWHGPRVIRQDGMYLHAISKYYPLYTKDRRSMKEALMFGLATLKLFWASFDILDVDSMPFFPIFSARLVCWLRGARLNATWHEVTTLEHWREYSGKRAGTAGWLIERLASRLPDRIIANSEQTTSRLMASGVRCPVVTVPLGVNTDFIGQLEPGRPTSDVIFAGRLLAHKNVDTLMRAIAIVKRRHPAISCIIIGDGPEKTNLVQLRRDLQLVHNITMLDFLDDAAGLYALMKASKMFVLPSVREGFSLAAIEANAAGLPVITTSHPDNNARNLITEGENGYLVATSAEDLAEAIERVLTHADGLNPKRHVAKYDWKHIAVSVEQALGAKS